MAGCLPNASGWKKPQFKPASRKTSYACTRKETVTNGSIVVAIVALASVTWTEYTISLRVLSHVTFSAPPVSIHTSDKYLRCQLTISSSLAVTAWHRSNADRLDRTKLVSRMPPYVDVTDPGYKVHESLQFHFGMWLLLPKVCGSWSPQAC